MLISFRVYSRHQKRTQVSIHSGCGLLTWTPPTCLPDIPGLTGDNDGDDIDMDTEPGPSGGVAPGGVASPVISPKKRKRKANEDKTPTKQAAPDEVTSPPRKKTKKEECKFGSKCYQTNPKHMERFYHPPKVNRYIHTSKRYKVNIIYIYR